MTTTTGFLLQPAKWSLTWLSLAKGNFASPRGPTFVRTAGCNRVRFIRMPSRNLGREEATDRYSSVISRPKSRKQAGNSGNYYQLGIYLYKWILCGEDNMINITFHLKSPNAYHLFHTLYAFSARQRARKVWWVTSSLTKPAQSLVVQLVVDVVTGVWGMCVLL